MKNEIKLIGTLLMFGVLILLMVFFYLAYQSEDKSVNIPVNNYGEANIEAFVIVPLFVILGTLATIIIIIEYNRKGEENE